MLIGTLGAGKKQWTIGAAFEAIEQGYQVMFLLIPELMFILKTTGYIKKSHITLSRIKQPTLAIVDDFMYIAMD